MGKKKTAVPVNVKLGVTVTCFDGMVNLNPFETAVVETGSPSSSTAVTELITKPVSGVDVIVTVSPAETLDEYCDASGLAVAVPHKALLTNTGYPVPVYVIVIVGASLGIVNVPEDIETV